MKRSRSWVTPLGFLSLLLLSPICFAQQAPSEYREWTSIEIVLSVAMIIFTATLIGIEAWIITRAKKTWAPLSILRVIGVTLILCFSVMLVIAGYGKDQLSQITGLLGVIAGYLLGQNDNKTTNSAPTQNI